MKKIALIFTLLILVACSSNSDDPEEILQDLPPVRLLIESTVTGTNIPVNLVEYTYGSDNKVTQVDFGDNRYEYNYSNGLMTRIERFVNGVYADEERFNYENNQIVSYLRFDMGGTVTFTRSAEFANDRLIEYSDNYTDPNISDKRYVMVYNLGQNSVDRRDTDNLARVVITFYDDKKNPRINDPYFRANMRSIGNTNYNNPLRIVSYDENAVILSDITFVNEYDNEDFLTKTTVFTDGVETRVETFRYNL